MSDEELHRFDEQMCRFLRAAYHLGSPECQAAARLEALRDERDALRDVLKATEGYERQANNRAEAAEAREKRLRGAVVRFCDDFVSRFSEPLTDPERGMLRAAAELRAALAPVESKGGDDGR